MSTLTWKVKQAIEHIKQSVSIAREIGDRKGEGEASGSLCHAYRTLGQIEANRNCPGAIECYERALASSREIGARSEKGGMVG